MWIFIWALVSITILGAFVWSVRVLFQQKAAWQAYAKKMNLNYKEGESFLSSPVLSGTIGSYGFSLFSEERSVEDARGQRFNTVIEIALRCGLPVPGAIGTPGMAGLIEALAPLNQTVSPQDKDWDTRWIIRTTSAKILEEQYLTPARLDIFKKIFRLKILAALFIFNEEDAVLRLETADPLHDATRLEKIVKGLIQQTDALVPDSPPKTKAPEEGA